MNKTIAVMVPTYRRPADLKRCLLALRNQERRADEVIIVFRPNDEVTRDLIDSCEENGLSIRSVEVKDTGAVAAYNAGLDAVRAEVVAICDDDAAPRGDWLLRIEEAFSADPRLGGIGGRDYMWEDGRPIEGAKSKVGRIQWFGRMIGNHHLGVGAARDVEILKGVNMSFRQSAIADMRFDARLKGEGAQVHLEVGFCTKLKQSGWHVIYDPAIAVDHYPSIRHDRDQRKVWDFVAAANASHNETLALLEYLPAQQRIAFLVWAGLVGTRAAPGLLQGPRFWLAGLPRPAARVRAGLRGRWLGWRTWRET